jgi:hypothetical protein
LWRVLRRGEGIGSGREINGRIGRLLGQPLTFLIVMARTAPEGSSRNRSTAAFVESFSANLPKLVASGYPKWREVNIAATIPDAQRFEAARRWLAARTPDAGPPQFTSSIRTKSGVSP